MLHRSPEHLLQFVSTELNTTVVFGKNNQLILRGKFYPKHIESVLRHYISKNKTNHRYSTHTHIYIYIYLYIYIYYRGLRELQDV